MILDKQQSASDVASGQERLDALLIRLRAAGYRLSKERQAVLQALVFSERHPAAEELYRQVIAAYPVHESRHRLQDLGYA